MTPDKVRLLAPEFAADPDELLTVFIDIALDMTSAAAWGKVYGTAIAYLAAHLKTVADQGDPSASGAGPGAGMGTTGGVASMAVGRWNVSFGGMLTGAEAGLDPGADGSLVTTRHGKMYLMLRKSRAAGKARLIRPKGTY